ncbi:hypothetical protein ACLM5H_06380 [Fredinandcohnia humi]
MLYYNDVKQITNDIRGVRDEGIVFEHMYVDPSIVTKKGLYVSKNDENREESLKTALYNGAIATIWPRDQLLPRFLPNHFPVFLVEDPVIAFTQIIELYVKKIEENRYDTMTKITFFSNETKNIIVNHSTKDEINHLKNIISMITEGRG